MISKPIKVSIVSTAAILATTAMAPAQYYTPGEPSSLWDTFSNYLYGAY